MKVFISLTDYRKIFIYKI